jgi:hypothetical protein
MLNIKIYKKLFIAGPAAILLSGVIASIAPTNFGIKLMKKIIIAAILLSYSSFSQAILIDNGSTTVDTATNLEWLDVTATLGESYNSVIGGFGGYIADGYSVATTSQICVLFGALGDSIANCPAPDWPNNLDGLAAANAAEFIFKFGDTALSLAGRAGTFGWFDSGYISSHYTVGLGGIIGAASSNTSASATINAAYARDVWDNLDGKGDMAGVWLVRDASVPEPAIIALFTLGLVGIGFARRKRQS